MMYMHSLVRKCDFTRRKYDSPIWGVEILVASPITGRVCCVMTAGPEYVKEQKLQLMSYEECVAITEETGYVVDF